MNCEKMFDLYLALDKNERVPFMLTVHLFFCPVCRAAVRQMSCAEKMVAEPLSIKPADRRAVKDPILTAAIDKILAAGLSYSVDEPVAKRVSLFRWFLVGVLLAGGFFVIPFSATGIWIQQEFGLSFMVPFYILFGCAVTAYGGLFIGSNIDLFVKRFKTLRVAT
ncbi:MAG TPA: hypothetical protein GXZ47_04905 [Treponema sp.]|nr:hypothetical protein [Treponema sp.]